MLIRMEVLQRVRSGHVTLAFRRWRRPTVKRGGTLRTAVGILTVTSLDRICVSGISAPDARAAGYPSRVRLLEELGSRDGDVYRIGLAYGGPDPRIALRDNDSLSDQEILETLTRLQRLDAASSVGPWTRRVLTQIQRHPKLAARDLAEETGDPKDRLKTNVRKLKNLGLTASHHPGYTLSPRGRTILKALKQS